MLWPGKQEKLHPELSNPRNLLFDIPEKSTGIVGSKHGLNRAPKHVYVIASTFPLLRGSLIPGIFSYHKAKGTTVPNVTFPNLSTGERNLLFLDYQTKVLSFAFIFLA